MPPGRRGRPPGSSNASRNPQQRISFGPNSTNKITKPSSLGPNAQKKASPRQKKQLERVIDDSSHKSASEEEETVREEQTNEPKALPIRQSEAEDVKTASQVSDARDKREEEASKISEAQIRKYWIHKEESRIAPRVHQQGLDVNEKVLREFDLSSQYGVSTKQRSSMSLVTDSVLAALHRDSTDETVETCGGVGFEAAIGSSGCITEGWRTEQSEL